MGKGLLAARKPIVREVDIRAKENIVLERGSVAHQSAVFQSHSVADDYIILDKNTVAEITIAAHDGTRKHVRKRPYASPVANFGTFTQPLGMNEETHGTHLRALPIG